jgi:hypothetical protein
MTPVDSLTHTPKQHTPAPHAPAPHAPTRFPLPAASAAPSAPKPVPKRPLPAGLPRQWYEAHNRQLKAMRIAIALLDSGVCTPDQARNRAIRRMAARIGARPPSLATCALVRSLLP